MDEPIVAHERRRGKKWWQSRANITNLCIAIITIIGLLMNMPEFAHITPWLVLATNVINVYIRIFLTAQPIDRGTP